MSRLSQATGLTGDSGLEKGCRLARRAWQHRAEGTAPGACCFLGTGELVLDQGWP